MGGVRLTLRVDFGTDRAIGPGKVLLLEAIRNTGSISQAGRSLGMSYRRAWLLVDDMNRCFREPVVTAQPGGVQGGGAALTAFGERVVQKYRKIEIQATAAAKPQLHDLEASLRAIKRGAAKSRRTSIRASTAR
ncbi:MAG TPA: winged helix-turn-helix domain-containing protein [Xanthobacteraceae bacterium]|jgi:molybdate transport system regulatory protein|nr:winged helix-turn-helix domain-containing protein [Xanthobacteraceae bacterium]